MNARKTQKIQKIIIFWLTIQWSKNFFVNLIIWEAIKKVTYEKKKSHHAENKCNNNLFAFLKFRIKKTPYLWQRTPLDI